MKIRAMMQSDLRDVAGILDGIELFPSEMLPDMASGFLGGAEDERWLVCESGGVVIGFCYTRLEALTATTWNMLALGVESRVHRQGVGQKLVTGMEDDLHSISAKVVIVETSSSDDFADARAFYGRSGYIEEARIRGFWGEGDDKVVFWKQVA